MNCFSTDQLATSELTTDVLSGLIVHGAADERIGAVGAVNGYGEEARLVIEVGGFMGLGTKPVALRAREFAFTRDTRGRVHVRTAWSKQAMKRLPEYRATYRPTGHSAL